MNLGKVTLGTGLRRLSGGVALAACLLDSSYANATTCSFVTDTGCWYDYSGPNYSQVAATDRAFFGLVWTGASGGDNWEVHAYQADAGAGASDLFMTSNLNDLATNPFRTAPIHHLVVQPPPDGGVGTTTLWALRVDGALFKSTGDTRFRDPNEDPEHVGDRFEPWQFVTSSQDASGATLDLRAIAFIRVSIPGSSSDSAIVGVATDGQVYSFDPEEGAGPWQPSPFFLSSTKVVFSDTGGATALELRGTDAYGTVLGTKYFIGPPAGQVPDVPQGVVLAAAGLPSFNCPNEPSNVWPFGFGIQSQTQPFSLGPTDAWLLKHDDGCAIGDFQILRSALGPDGWSDWFVYDTGAYTDLDAGRGDYPPWSIVDAYRLRDLRGELLLIGDNFHLLRYIPGTSIMEAPVSDGVPLELAFSAATEGSSSWVVESGWSLVDTGVIDPALLSTVGTELTLDVFIPEYVGDYGWLGDVGISLSIPSAGISHHWLGGQTLTPEVTDDWEQARIPLDPSISNILATIPRDVEFHIEMNVPIDAEFALIDFLRFSGALVFNDAVCGDGALGAGEDCDDANLDDGDGCSSTCQTEQGPCSAATAIDMGSVNTVTQVPSDSCLMISAYPGSWMNSVVVQPQAGGDYPISLSWENCGSAGEAALGGEWQQIKVEGINQNCPAFIQLGGDGFDSLTLAWWGNG